MTRDLLVGKCWSVGISSYRPESSPVRIRIDDRFTVEELDALIDELRRWADQQRRARA